MEGERGEMQGQCGEMEGVMGANGGGMRRNAGGTGENRGQWGKSWGNTWRKRCCNPALASRYGVDKCVRSRVHACHLIAPPLSLIKHRRSMLV